VGSDDQGGVGSLDAAQEKAEQMLGSVTIELARGLVSEYQLRLRDEAARDGGALRLSPRDLLRQLVGELREIESPEYQRSVTNETLLGRRVSRSPSAGQRTVPLVGSSSPARR